MTARPYLKLGTLLVVLGALPAIEGCSSTLAQPFDKMKTADMTVYRLQNYEVQQPPPGATPGPGGIPDIIQKGAQILQQWGLPPIPGLTPGAVPAPAPDQTQRFYNFRILAMRPVVDAGVKSDLATLFGTSDNFTNKPDTCMYPEFGVAMYDAKTGTHADLAVSTSCEQVRALNFQWPYSNIGVPPDTSRKLVELVKKVYQGG